MIIFRQRTVFLTREGFHCLWKGALLVLFVSTSIKFSRADSSSHVSRVGIADLGMMSPQWPCNEKNLSEKGFLSISKAVLWNTFGNAQSCLVNNLKDKKFKVLELYLLNEVCLKHGSCDPHEFFYGMSLADFEKGLLSSNKELEEKLRVYISEPSDFIRTNIAQSVQCYISPSLESRLSFKAASRLFDIVRPYFPQCAMVWNPLSSKARRIENTFFEYHGPQPVFTAPCVASLDGVDVELSDRKAVVEPKIGTVEVKEFLDKSKECKVRFLWSGESNGLTTGSFISPLKRKNFHSLFVSQFFSDLIAEFGEPSSSR